MDSSTEHFPLNLRISLLDFLSLTPLTLQHHLDLTPLSTLTRLFSPLFTLLLPLLLLSVVSLSLLLLLLLLCETDIKFEIS